jgi:hypothetical protein
MVSGSAHFSFSFCLPCSLGAGKPDAAVALLLLRPICLLLLMLRRRLRCRTCLIRRRLAMRSRRVWLARTLILIEAGDRRARPIGPEDKEREPVQSHLRGIGRSTDEDQCRESRRHLARGLSRPAGFAAGRAFGLVGLGLVAGAGLVAASWAWRPVPWAWRPAAPGGRLRRGPGGRARLSPGTGTEASWGTGNPLGGS